MWCHVSILPHLIRYDSVWSMNTSLDIFLQGFLKLLKRLLHKFSRIWNKLWGISSRYFRNSETSEFLGNLGDIHDSIRTHIHVLRSKIYDETRNSYMKNVREHWNAVKICTRLRTQDKYLSTKTRLLIGWVACSNFLFNLILLFV